MGAVTVKLVQVVGLWERLPSSWWQKRGYGRDNSPVGGRSGAMGEVIVQLVQVVGLWEG